MIVSAQPHILYLAYILMKLSTNDDQGFQGITSDYLIFLTKGSAFGFRYNLATTLLQPATTYHRLATTCYNLATTYHRLATTLLQPATTLLQPTIDLLQPCYNLLQPTIDLLQPCYNLGGATG